MSTSFLDTLSCALAAVIILLLIALSSSEDQSQPQLEAVVFDIRVIESRGCAGDLADEYRQGPDGANYADVIIVGNQIALNGAPVSLEVIKDFDRELRYAANLPAPWDNTEFRIYQPTWIRGELVRDMMISVTPDPDVRSAEPFEIELALNTSAGQIRQGRCEYSVAASIMTGGASTFKRKTCERIVGESVVRVRFAERSEVDVLLGDSREPCMIVRSR